MARGATRIPYAFAKANGVVVTSLDEGLAQVAVREGASAGALAELRREFTFTTTDTRFYK